MPNDGNWRKEKDPVEREVLGSVYLKGKLHAIYPTAHRTLCGLECSPRGEVMLSAPTCLKCQKPMRAMWDVDKSVPAEWLESEGAGLLRPLSTPVPLSSRSMPIEREIL